MYAFELAAEFKARSQRNLVLITTASVRSFYHISVTSYKILYDVLLTTFQEKKPQTNRKYKVHQRRGGPIDQNDEEQYEPIDDAASQSTNYRKQQQRSTSTARQTPSTTISTTEQSQQQQHHHHHHQQQQQSQMSNNTVPGTGLDADEKTLEEFRLFQQMLASRQTTVPTTPQVSKIIPKQSTVVKSASIPSPPYLPGFLGPDGELIPSSASTTTATAKPTTQQQSKPKPKPSQTTTSSGIDLSELTRRPLRKVDQNADNAPQSQTPAQKTAPTGGGGIDLTELTRRPLRKVTADENNNTNNTNNTNTPAFPQLRPVNKNPQQQQQPKQDESVVVRGKRIESSSIPGEANMSFSDRIKVASKMTLKSSHLPRSPGGTPRRERKQEQSEFFTALRHKFKNVNRESIEPTGEESETDW
jgi:hypothetical protein